MTRLITQSLTSGILALAALTALPASAQDANLCGGVGANGQWLGGDEATSDISTTPSYVEQMALVLMRNEYVGLFTVSEAGDYRIEAAGRGAGDTVIDVRDASGQIVASDDDSGGNSDSRAEVFLSPDTYCVSMRSFGGNPLTGFVRAGRLEHEPLTAGLGGGTFDDYMDFSDTGCDFGAMTPIQLGETLTNPITEQRYYSLRLDAPTSITITAENEAADPVLTLYNASNDWLAENDDYDGLNSRIDITYPLLEGEYCIALRALNDESLPITVTAKVYDSLEAQAGLYAYGDAAPPLDGTYPVIALGDLSTRLREDANVGGDAIWYAFDVTESGLVVVEAIAQGSGDPVLYMYDDLGRQLGYNDDAGPGTLDSMLAVRVQPGTYLVAVKQLSSMEQGMIRLLFERYVSARP